MHNKLGILYIENLEVLKNVCCDKNIYLYGAGNRAFITYEILKERDILIKGFIVSNANGNPTTKNNLPVVVAEDYSDDNAIVIFAIDVKDSNMCRQIVSHSIEQVYIFDRAFYDEEFCKYFKSQFCKVFNDNKYEIVEESTVERHHILCRYKHDNGDLIFRVPPHILYSNCLEMLKEKLLKKNPYELFAECYGTFDFLPNVDNAEDDGKTYNVYMARCHVDKEIDIPDIPEWIIPIQTGAALTDKKICEVRDNQGENVSEKNRDYSECTAIYWMWKNAPKTDYIGLCHYRRHFFIPDNKISLIGNNGYDVVVTIPTIVTNNYKFFRTYVKEEDIDTLCEAIKNKFPEYYDVTNKYYSSDFCPPCNMFIMRYDIFQEYGKFVFGVCEKIDEHYSQKGIIRNDRYMGFLIENLTDIFLMKNKDNYKIGYTHMKFID